MKANIKIGDVFSVEINDQKRYFQYIAKDLTQLNSEVIRAFKRKYAIDERAELVEIVKDEVDFCAHVFLKLGIKMQFWKKEGNIANVGKIDNILFKDTNDYGIKLGDVPVKTSNKWHVWRINENFSKVGKLEGDNQKAFVGLVINPLGIIELLKGNKYPPTYPE
jgi:hypothetical protein